MSDPYPTKAYLVGKMSGEPNNGFPAFREATRRLRSEGWEIVSPVELDEKNGITDKTILSDEEYRDVLLKDFQVVADPTVKCLIALPGWEESYGANAEVAFARALGKPVYLYPDLFPVTAWRATREPGHVQSEVSQCKCPGEWTPDLDPSFCERCGNPRGSYAFGKRRPGQFEDECQDSDCGVSYTPPARVETRLFAENDDAPTMRYDSAGVRVFESGATRDLDHSKLDYEGFLSPLVLRRYAEYMHENRHQKDGNVRASDNWQKGIPLDAYMKSGWRHHMDWWSHHRGEGFEADADLERTLCAVLFNASGYLFEHLKAGGS